MKEVKLVGVLCLALFALCITGIAQAQTASPCPSPLPWNSYCLQWTAPTTNTDGSAITRALTYRVEQRAGTSGTWTPVASSITALRAYVSNLTAGTYYFRVYASCSGCTESEASGLSPAIALTAPPPPQPNPPVIVIAVTIAAGAPPTAVQVNGQQVYANRP